MKLNTQPLRFLLVWVLAGALTACSVNAVSGQDAADASLAARVSAALENSSDLPANALEDVLSGGYGIVNIIAHGGNSIFCVRTSGYNEWPKSLFSTDAGSTSHGDIRDLSPNGRSAL